MGKNGRDGMREPPPAPSRHVLVELQALILSMNHAGRPGCVVVIGCGSIIAAGVLQALGFLAIRNPSLLKRRLGGLLFSHSSTVKVPSADSITRYLEEAIRLAYRFTILRAFA